MPFTKNAGDCGDEKLPFAEYSAVCRRASIRDGESCV